VLFTPSALVQRCESLGCDYLVLPIIFASQDLIDTASSLGIKVWNYGIETGPADKADIMYLASLGIAGFIVDQPIELLEYFTDLVPAKQSR